MASMVPRFGKGISDYAAVNAFSDDFVSYKLARAAHTFAQLPG